MHALQRVIDDVEKTHRRLGKAVAFALAAVKAKKCLLIISPAGTGKSTIAAAVAEKIEDKMLLDSITRSGLFVFQDRMSNFGGLVVIDDMGKIDTIYGRLSTITTFAELVYSHFIAKHTISSHVEISHFFGSAILCAQPPIVAQLVQNVDWEAVTQDKTIRYYHLFRPVEPHAGLPQFEVNDLVNIDQVAMWGVGTDEHINLLSLASQQWSDARVLEHTRDLLKAAAALDGRQVVDKSDYVLLLDLMRPLALERSLISKYTLETDRTLNLNLLAMLVELSSWDNLSVARVARDYMCDHTTVHRVLNSLSEYFVLAEGNPGRIRVTPKTQELLRLVGAM